MVKGRFIPLSMTDCKVKLLCTLESLNLHLKP